MKKTVIESGIYMLDTILERQYPVWPALRPFEDRTVVVEVGGTCGNVMCMLAWMGWDSRPQASLDDSPEGLQRAFAGAYEGRWTGLPPHSSICYSGTVLRTSRASMLLMPGRPSWRRRPLPRRVWGICPARG